METRQKLHELLLVSPRVSVPPTTGCYGPFQLPHSARSIHAFMPTVDLGVVHHFGVFASPKCWHGGADMHVLYMWARSNLEHALAVGEPITGPPEIYQLPKNGSYSLAYATTTLYLNVHWVVPPETRHLDPGLASVRVLWSEDEPRTQVRIKHAICWKFAIPPGLRSYEVSCSSSSDLIKHDMELLFFRNHAHRAGVDIWTSVSRGRTSFDIGRRSPQLPQVMTPFDPYVLLRAGDKLTLHCVFTTSTRNFTTQFGFHEESEEMCLQYRGYTLLP